MARNEFAAVLLAGVLAVTGELCPRTQEPAAAATFRDPFTVSFEFPGKGRVEQPFDKTPYVSEKTIQVFPGEEFGVEIKSEGDDIVEISYQPDLKKADVKFKFEVQKLGKQSAMMMLTTKSQLDKTLIMEAWMLLPGRKDAVKTSLYPVLPHLMGIESWPQPILKLELKNLRLAPPPKGLNHNPK